LDGLVAQRQSTRLISVRSDGSNPPRPTISELNRERRAQGISRPGRFAPAGVNRRRNLSDGGQRAYPFAGIQPDARMPQFPRFENKSIPQKPDYRCR